MNRIKKKEKKKKKKKKELIQHNITYKIFFFKKDRERGRG